MALKGDRQVTQTAPPLYEMHELSERGVMVMSDVGNADRVVLASSSGDPIGMLLTDVEDLDLTDRPQPLHRMVVASGDVVAVATIGQFKTNMIPSGTDPFTGEDAYLATDGELSNTGTVDVGRWLSEKDSDGYAWVSINVA